MEFEIVSAKIESAKKQRLAQILDRQGLTLSSFIRKSADDFLEVHGHLALSRQFTPPEGPEAA